MRISNVDSRPERVEAEIDVGGALHRVHYHLPPSHLSEVAPAAASDAMAAAALLPAMRTGRTLEVEVPVSPRLLSALDTIQDIFSSWKERFPIYGRYSRIAVEARTRIPTPTVPGRGTAAFFTGGVDSFYTAVRHRHELDALIFVHGFDFSPEDERKEVIVRGVRAAARDLGKPLIEVGTDLRAFSDGYAHWEAYHGAALASVALLLSAAFSKVYIPATLTYAHLIPLGSHPLLDPLWSTEELEIVHDGCEASRLGKLRVVADEPAARRWLRVCWENHDGKYNCGRCEKCLRTMVAMRALGLLDRFETFPTEIDLDAVTKVDLPEIRYAWDASLQLLEQSRTDPAFTRMLRRRLYSPRARVVRRTLHYRRRILQLANRS